MDQLNAKSSHTFQVTEEVSPVCPDSSEISSSKNDETFKKCCVDSLGNQEDFMVVESSSTMADNISTFNSDDTKYISMCKDVAFKKKQISNNIPSASYMFEDIIKDDNSDVSESSICLSRFQKRKRLLPPNNKDFVEINLSDNSEMDSANNSIEPLKFGFSKKNIDQSCVDGPDYSLSSTVSTDGIQVTNEDNISQTEEQKLFKKPLDSFLVNNSTAEISKTETSEEESIRKSTEEFDAAFDNFLKDLSAASMVRKKRKKRRSRNHRVSNVNRMALCSSMEMPSFNRTYDIPPNGNSTQNILHSQSINDKKSTNTNTTVGLPINETYTLDSSVMSQSNGNVSTRSVNAKTLLSDTYIIENNPNATFTKRRSSLRKSNNTINTLGDVSNKSKSSAKKQTFLRKLQLDNVSQDFNVTINNSDDSILNDDNINDTKDDKYKKFKAKKINHSEDFEVFDNIISSSQKNELMTSKSSVINNSTTNTLTPVAETSNDSDLYISSKSIENTEELTKQSNVILDGAVENDKSICPTSVSRKSNSFNRSSFKFDFIKQFGRHSLSYQEKSMSSSKIVKPHNISLSNSIFNKTFEERSNTFHKSVDNVNLDSNLVICETPKSHKSSQKSQQFTVSLPPVFTTTGKEIQENNLESSQDISLKSSQSSESCFTGKHNINGNSEIFSNLIDDSLNNDVSLDVSKQIKFKNYKNISSAHSIVFENVLTSSQESPDSTVDQNKILGQTVLCEQSNTQGEEISVFANSIDLLSNNESIDSPVRCSKKLKLTNYSNVEEPRCSKNEMNILNNSIGDSNLNHTKAESTIEKISETSVINTTNQRVQNNSSNINNTNKSLVSFKMPSNNLSKKTSMILEEDSIMHDQASNNCTTNQNNVMTQSTLYNDTKNQGDEISMFTNTDELLSYSKSIGFDQNIDTDKKSNSKELKNSVNELNILDKTSTDSNSKHSKTNFSQGKTFGVSTSSNRQYEQNDSLSLRKSINKQSTKSILQSLTQSMSSSSNNSSTLKDNSKNIGRNSSGSNTQKNPSFDNVNSSLPNSTIKLKDKGLLLINNAGKFSEQSDLSITNQLKRSTSKHRISSISRDKSSTLNKSSVLENDRNSSSKTFCAPKQKTQSFSNKVSTSLVIVDEFKDTDELPQLNTIGTLEKKDMSTNQSKRSTSKRRLSNVSEDESCSLNKSSILENTRNNSSETSRLSKQRTHSYSNKDSASFNINDGFQDTGLSLFIDTDESLEQSDLPINKSKRSTSKRHISNTSRDGSIASNKSSILENNQNKSNRISSHSLKQKPQSSSNKVSASFNITDGFQDTGLSLFNDTDESLEQSNLPINKSNKSVCLTKKKIQSVNNEGSTSLLIADEFKDTNELAQLNNTIGTLEKKDMSTNRSKRSTSKCRLSNTSRDGSITSNKSSILENNLNKSNRISSHSLIQKPQSSSNKDSASFNITDGFQDTDDSLEQSDLPINQSKKSTSKRRISNISRDESITSNKSVCSTMQKIQSVNNEGSTSLLIADEFQDADLTQLNKTVGAQEQKDISIKQSKHQSLNVTKDKSFVSNKSLKLKENTNYSYRPSAHLSVKKTQSMDSVESKISNITNGSLSKNKSLPCKTSNNNHNANVMPVASTSTSSSVVNCNNEDTVSENQNSLFWTTVSENSSSKSRDIQNANSENGQLSVAEKIDKIIENMSVNKLTANHPGAFVLYECGNQPLTRSSSKRLSSPSILTRALPRLNSSDLTFTDISLPGSDINNHIEIKERVKEKYQSLYNKEPWITKRLYNFLVGKLQLRYKIFAIKQAEKFVKFLATIFKQVYSDKNVDLQLYSDMLRYHMARYGIINTTADYLGFLTDYIPNPYYDKLMPGWNYKTSLVKFDDQKYFKTIMEDETFLNMILEKLNV